MTTPSAMTVRMTARSLDRSFDRLLGVSPKQYAWMERLYCVYTKFLQNPDTNVQELIYRLGYYDQSHLINDLKKYSDITPLDLKKEESNSFLSTYKLNNNVNQELAFEA